MYRMKLQGVCKNQAFLVPNRVLGLQFHLEITPSVIRSLNDRATGDRPANEHVDELPPARDPVLQRNHDRMGTVLDQFLRS